MPDQERKAAMEPFVAALLKSAPAPSGIKPNVAEADAKSMLVWWSVPQTKSVTLLRVNGSIVRLAQHACPKCAQPLTASLLKLSKREQAIAAVLEDKLTAPDTDTPADEPQ